MPASLAHSSNLAYNLVELLWAYAYMCRLSQGDILDAGLENCTTVLNLSQVLGSQRAFAYTSLGDVVESLCDARAKEVKF